MSADTVPSSSSNGDSRSQSGTEMMDQSDYIYMIPEQERINICYYLNEIWEEAAKKMGYTPSDIIVSQFCVIERSVWWVHTLQVEYDYK